MNIPVFTDWRLLVGQHLDRRLVPLVVAAAIAAVVVSAISVFTDRRKGRAAGLFALRTAAVACCLTVALEPSLELAQVTRIPNHVAVLVDASRSMSVAPPDGGPSRKARAAKIVADAEPMFERWRKEGHRVDVFTFGEALAPSAPNALATTPDGEATRIGEALTELRAKYAGRDLGAVVMVSDGIDTGRIGPGPLDGETRNVVQALGAPVHGVLVDEKALKDISIATVLADDFAFVRTPIKLEAIVRQSGLPNRQVEVTLKRDGRIVDARTVLFEGDHSETKVSFPFTPEHPGQFVFEIATPVLAGEALPGNNKQVFTIKVIRDRIRVLHVCGRPSWDQRFVRSLLRLNPNVDLVSFFILRTESDERPWNPNDLSLIPFPDREVFEEQLRSFDLLVFHNFNYGPYHVEPYLPGVRDYVEAGGALVMIGGDLSFASGGYGTSALQDILPVSLDGIPPTGERAFSVDRFKPKLTSEGASHPVTALSLDTRANEQRWSALPPLEGMNRVAGLRPGAAALLVHPSQKSADGKAAPLLAVADVGKGRTMALLTDSAWHWGFLAAGGSDDGRAFQRFWDGAIRWLVRDPALTLLRLDLDRAEYVRGQSVRARVRTLRPDYTPAAGIEVKVELRPADVESGAPLVEQTVTTNRDGEAHLDLATPGTGAFRLQGKATVEGRPQSEQKTFLVRAEGKELEDVVGRSAVLEELATLTGGTFARGSLDDVPRKKLREERIGSQRTIDVWSHPMLLVAALLFLMAEWYWRRRAGHA